MESESEEIREVFAQYGLAMYLAQTIERPLIDLLCTVAAPSPHMGRARIDDLRAEYGEWTFGQLLRKLEQTRRLDPSWLCKLRKAKEGRDYLAHQFWWDQAAQFSNRDTRPEMLTELGRHQELFQQLVADLYALIREWVVEQGIGLDEWEETMKEDQIALVNDAGHEEAPPAPRRPQKSERLVGLYLYQVGGTGAYFFKFSDGTLWEPADNGLVHHRDPVGEERLRELRIPELDLPLDIAPRPKRAGPWDYCIALGPKYHMAFWPAASDSTAPVHVKILPLIGGHCTQCDARRRSSPKDNQPTAPPDTSVSD